MGVRNLHLLSVRNNLFYTDSYGCENGCRSENNYLGDGIIKSGICNCFGYGDGHGRGDGTGFGEDNG